MDITYKLKHFANKTLLSFFGPADLDDHNDPRVALSRDYDSRYHPEKGTSTSATATGLPASERKAIA